MQSPPLVIYRYRYIPKNIVIILDKEYKLRDNCIMYLNIINDYTRRRFPVIQCGMEMEAPMIDQVYKNQDKAKIKFDVYEQQTTDDGNKVVGTKLYLKHTFSIIPMRDKNVYITTTDTKTEEKLDPMRSLQRFEMYLIDMDYVNIFSRQLSYVMKNVTYGAALQSAFMMRNIPAKTVIATPPVQNGLIDYVVMPLEDMVNQIEYLNHNYGIYDDRPIVYYDLNTIYCVSKVKPNITLPSATDYGNVTFILLNSDNPARWITGSNDDMTTQTHYINIQQMPQIIDTTVKDVNSKFSTLASVDSKGKVKKDTIDDNATTLQYVRSYNELTMNQIKNETITGHMVAVTFNDISLRCLKPYKDYRFDVDTTFTNLNLMARTYRILSWYVNIRREGSDSYLHDGNIVLYCPEGGGVPSTGSNVAQPGTVG